MLIAHVWLRQPDPLAISICPNFRIHVDLSPLDAVKIVFLLRSFCFKNVKKNVFVSKNFGYLS